MYHSPTCFFRLLAVTGLGLLLLAACGGGGGGGSGGGSSSGASISISVTGLTAGDSLRLSYASDSVTFTSDGTRTLSSGLASGSVYAVSITTQPQGRVCVFANDVNSGTLGASSVTLRMRCFDRLRLAPQLGNAQVDLRWNTVGAGDYRLFWSTTPGVPADDPAGTANVSAQTSETVSPLVNDTVYYFQVEFEDPDGPYRLASNVATASPQVPFSPAGVRFNDTGVDRWSDGVGVISAAQVGPPGQDADFGRDADGTLVKIGSGQAGFDFSRISNAGRVFDDVGTPLLADGAGEWGCTRDNVTGLYWEVKVNQAGALRHREHRYTWRDTDADSNAGNAGSVGGATCGGTLTPGCNMQAYTQRVNAEGLCGYSDWRVPSQSELFGLLRLRLDEAGAKVDTDFHPNLQTTNYYWTATSWGGNPGAAWRLGMVDAQDLAALKTGASHVVLVRGEGLSLQPNVDDRAGECNVSMESTVPSLVLDGATAHQAGTGLEWARCPWATGQAWNNPGCHAVAEPFTWSDALGTAVSAANTAEYGGHNDWRLPNVKELNAVLERRCSEPSVDADVFPGIPGDRFFWTATPNTDAANQVLTVDLEGDIEQAGDGAVINSGYVLLVRDRP